MTACCRSPYARDIVAVDRSTYWAPNYWLLVQTGGKSGEAPTGDMLEGTKVFDQLKVEHRSGQAVGAVGRSASACT